MQKTILIVNGEAYWPDFFPDFQVVQKRVQDSTWMIRDGELLVYDHEGVVKPDGILWRVGAIRPGPAQITALNLIELAGVPCVNSPATLKMGFDRLSMLSVIRKLGLPNLDFQVVSRPAALKNIPLPYPFVVKAGNYHGGFGKALVENEKQWLDVRDLLFMSGDYVTVEPYVEYVRDIRYMAIGEGVWAMSRRGKFWKANVETVDFEPIEPVEPGLGMIRKLQAAIRADIVAIDILEDSDGRQFVIEYNDIPGLSGFSDELKYELAGMLAEKMDQEQNRS